MLALTKWSQVYADHVTLDFGYLYLVNWGRHIRGAIPTRVANSRIAKWFTCYQFAHPSFVWQAQNHRNGKWCYISVGSSAEIRRLFSRAYRRIYQADLCD